MNDADDTGKRPPERLDLEPTEADEPARTPPGGRRAPDLATLLRTGERWGWVDEDGGIHVRAGRYNPDRVVARVPPSRRAETLAALLLRFQELEQRWTELRQELRRSKSPSRSLKSLQSFVRWVEGAEAIGDYDQLLGRAHAEIARIEGLLEQGHGAKLALVERAEALAASTSWKGAGELMDELMLEWKQAGSAGRAADEELWNRFERARRTFFARRKEHFAELRHERSRSRAAKEELIARAEALAPSTELESTFDAMQALLEEWKRAGSAGPDVDDQLWERFRAARDPFFARRREHIAEQRRRQEERPRRDEGGPRGPGGPERRDRAGRASGGGRPRRGAAPDRPAGGRPRGGEPGVLRASLAEIVGPLRDLFPAARSDQEPDQGRDDEDGPRTDD